MNNVVSVIVPCYNGEKTIERCLESVYIQESTLPLELIVVDDGSTDGSSTIINKWEHRFFEKGYILKYVHQNNMGPGAAINTGLKYVTGKYLSLLDADDCFLQGSIVKRTIFLDNNPDYAGVRTNGWMDKQGQQRLFDQAPDRTTNTNLFDGLIGGQATNWAGSYMIRTDVLFNFYPDREIYPSRFGQHMQILLPVAYKHKFGYIDEPLMIYYLQQTSHSQAATPQEQLKKNDLNFYGYQDIYRHVISQVVKDDKERDYYLNIVDSWKYKHELNKAILKKDKQSMYYFYKAYLETGRVTLNDKIEFYSVSQPLIAIILKIYRKIYSVLLRI